MGFNKIFDDPKLKVLDDPKLKPVDDPKIKAFDDPKFKVLDDPKLKFIDDPVGSFKGLDDVKAAGYDKIFGDQKFAGLDQIDWRNPAVFPQAQPFILSTPHHAAYPGASAQPASELEQLGNYLKQLQQGKEGLQSQMKQLDEAIAETQKRYKALEEEQKKSGKNK